MVDGDIPPSLMVLFYWNPGIIDFFSAVRPDAFSHLKRYCVKITDQGWLSAVKLN